MPVSISHSAEDLCRKMLTEIGENPEREGLLKTPERFRKAFEELTCGYAVSVQDAVGDGIFQSESPGIILVKDIEFFSLCEHHLLPFVGKASIAYLPGKKILGLSKLARVVELFARRLQVQERLTKEVADSIEKLVDARAVKVVIEATHMCMSMRGIRKINAVTRTEYQNIKDSLTEEEKRSLASV
jgi:GTP cyclohydrolase I